MVGSNRPRDLAEEETEQTETARVSPDVGPPSRRDIPCLVVLTGGNIGRVVRLSANLVLGRSSKCKVHLDDEGVSRRHARISSQESGYAIEDLDSANGTFVNGTEVKRLRMLEEGDKIRVGASTVLKFTVHDRFDEEFQQHMHNAALRDALTQVFNKAYFTSRLATEFAYAKRHRTRLAVLLFDVDHFKRINDEHGHPFGDYVLARIAKVASTSARAEDVVARCGGEEFGVICRGATMTNTVVFAERLRAMVAALPFEQGPRSARVTISVGVAAFPELPAASPDELFSKADAALYGAKRDGRDRVRRGAP